MIKKTLILLLASLTSQSQVLHCDSIEYSIQSGLTSTTLVLQGSTNLPVLQWVWAVADMSNNFLHVDSNISTASNQLPLHDTLKVAYRTEVTVGGGACTCVWFGLVIYNWPEGWILINTGTPLPVDEIKLYYRNDHKIYDLTGRTIVKPKKGVVYIRNREKFITN